MESTHAALTLFKSDRIGLMAQELRDPAASVIDNLEQVLEGVEPLTARQRLLISGARERARHMRDVVDDVQDAARFVHGDNKPHVSLHDLRTAVRDAIERNASAAAHKSIALTSELPGTALQLRADRRMVVQLFNNLISNAIKFSEAGSTVRAGARRTATGVEGWVSDEGAGMHPFDLPHLFQKFPRPASRVLDSARSTGLGLYIVGEILRLHHGTIRVMTEPGKGSTFVFELPRRAR